MPLVTTPQLVRRGLVYPEDLEQADDSLNWVGRIDDNVADGACETGFTEFYSFISRKYLRRVLRMDGHQGDGPRWFRSQAIASGRTRTIDCGAPFKTPLVVSIPKLSGLLSVCAWRKRIAKTPPFRHILTISL